MVTAKPWGLQLRAVTVPLHASTSTSDPSSDNAADKLTYDEAVSRAATLNLGGYSDWRLPTIKELFSLIDFSGVDPSGYEDDDTSGLIPFINMEYFDFAYGDTAAGERVIDAQSVCG